MVEQWLPPRWPRAIATRPLLASAPALSAADERDRLLLTLAIAPAAILRGVLTQCTPEIATPPQLGRLTLRVSVPLTPQTWVDGLLAYERIRYVLGTVATGTTTPPGATSPLHRCQTPLQTIEAALSYEQALTVLYQFSKFWLRIRHQ